MRKLPRQPLTRKGQIHTGMFRAQASIIDGSYDEEKLTMDVEFASEYPVLRYSWENDEYYNEVLEISDSAVDFSRVEAGASVLKDHRNGVDFIVGVTIRGWVEGKKAKATVQFDSTDESASFRQRVKEKIIRNISVGYEIDSYKRSQTDKKSIAQYTAIRWTPNEISFVAVPADPTVGAGRSKAFAKKEGLALRNSDNLHLTTLTDMTFPKGKGRGKTHKVRDAENDDDENEEITDPETDDDDDDDDQEEQAPVRKLRAVQKPAPKAVLNKAERAAIQTEERERLKSIRALGDKFKLDSAFIDEHETAGTSVDKFRELAIEKWEGEDPAKGVRNQNKIQMKTDEKDKLRSVRGMALAIRTGHIQEEDIQDKALRSAANEYRSFGLLDMARICLEEAGERTHMMSKRQIAQRAISPQVTGEFPELLNALASTILLPKYIEEEYVWREFASTGSLSDFKEYNAIRSWGLKNLERVNESEEYKQIPLVDATGEKVRLFKHGGIVSLSWEAIVNDELGAFNEIISDLGGSCARTLEDTVFDMFLLNTIRGPLMADGKATYHVDHNNLLTAGPFSEANLDLMRQRMASWTDGNGKIVGSRPSILLINTADAMAANKYNTSAVSLDATSKSSLITNPVANMFKKIVESPRVTAGYKYVFPDPRIAPVVRVSFLDGEKSPVIERHEEFRQDALNWKVRYVFGANIVNYRGTVLTPGN